MSMVRETSVRSAHKGQRLRAGIFVATAAGAALSLGAATSALAEENDAAPILPLTVTASTVATNGDVNPYGVAFVPPRFAAGGILKPGDLLENGVLVTSIADPNLLNGHTTQNDG